MPVAINIVCHLSGLLVIFISKFNLIKSKLLIKNIKNDWYKKSFLNLPNSKMKPKVAASNILARLRYYRANSLIELDTTELIVW